VRGVSLRLAAIVEALGGELLGEPDTLITALAPLRDAPPGSLSFLADPRYAGDLGGSRASCLVVAPESRDAASQRGACIVTGQPYLYFARVTQLWRRHLPAPDGPAVHPSACIHPDAVVDPSARIGAFCVVEAGARIGAGTELKSRVTVSADCVLGERCLVHSGVVIGADGFGFAPDAGRWEKIEQLGAVLVGDDVEIGANTCIDRGALQHTVIGDGVKLDNLIQIGHNVRVGRHTAMAACVGVAGSASIGEHCTLGGGAIVLGHLQLVDHVHVSAASVVTRSILKPGQYTGFFPLDANDRWERNAALLKRLHELRPLWRNRTGHIEPGQP
jgi:UDP-3-O-[3-hydroxymyristoyl] glucosamine N-acyltransferase